jgi:hypothetical protein
MTDVIHSLQAYFEALLADIDSKLGYMVQGHATLTEKVDEVLGRFGGMDDHLEGIELHLESVTGQLHGLERRLDGRGARRRSAGTRARSRRAT